MTATGSACSSCGIELPQNAKFCLECGAAVSTAAKSAEYKQVTVLFADVVHSMEIAASVGAERLREIMADLVDRAVMVVKRYGGTVDKFAGPLYPYWHLASAIIPLPTIIRRGRPAPRVLTATARALRNGGTGPLLLGDASEPGDVPPTSGL